MPIPNAAWRTLCLPARRPRGQRQAHVLHSWLSAQSQQSNQRARIRSEPLIISRVYSQCTLIYLMDHLALVVSQSDRNKMVPQNLAVCFGPVLMLQSDDSSEVLDFVQPISVLKYLLEIWPIKSGNVTPWDKHVSASQSYKMQNFCHHDSVQTACQLFFKCFCNKNWFKFAIRVARISMTFICVFVLWFVPFPQFGCNHIMLAFQHQTHTFSLNHSRTVPTLSQFHTRRAKKVTKFKLLQLDRKSLLLTFFALQPNFFFIPHTQCLNLIWFSPLQIYTNIL